MIKERTCAVVDPQPSRPLSVDVWRLRMCNALTDRVYFGGRGVRPSGGAEGVRRGAAELQIFYEEGQGPGRGGQVCVSDPRWSHTNKRARHVVCSPLCCLRETTYLCLALDAMSLGLTLRVTPLSL